jgi:predicted Rossmann fold flavoprotein
MPEFSDLAIAGGGAAGLACAVAAGRLGLRAVVLEKGETCGRKLAITGGRKGNFSHVESPHEIAERFDCGAKVLTSLFRRFPYQRIVQFFAGLGIQSRVDSDGCVWPVRADAPAIRDALLKEAQKLGCRFAAGARVVRIRPGWSAMLADGTTAQARNLCLATGGASYPGTGSTGDGLGLAGELGLATTPWFPALASLKTREDLSRLAGIAQPRVKMELVIAGRQTYAAEGHFLFAHQYVSGSSVLNLCGHAARALALGQGVSLRVDWVPDLNREQVAEALTSGREQQARQKLLTFLVRFVSRRLAEVLIRKAGVPEDRRMCDLSRVEQESLARTLKMTEFGIVGTEPMERATVTGGGVSLDEVDLTTMQARRFPGLYFAGEVLDLWAETGGYNLHFAWASGIRVAETIAGRELA